MFEQLAVEGDGSAHDRETLARVIRSLEEAQRLASLGSWHWDLEGDVLEWSDEVFRILGLEPGSVEPSYELLLRLVHPDDRDRVDSLVEESMASPDGRYDAQYRIRWPDGSVHHIHALGEVTRDVDGELVRMLGTVLDVTERVEAGERARMRSEQLSGALRRTEEAAAAERRAVDRERRFITAISHELRTPMTVIRGVVELLSRVEDGPTRDELTSALAANVDRLGHLIEDLLMVAEGDDEHAGPRRRTAVTELVARALAGLPDGVTVDVHVTGVDDVVVEEQSVAAALAAMLDNAVRYGGAGPVELLVRGDGADVVVEVADRGPGIPAEARSRVFAPFVRASATVDHAPGAGLGLAVVSRCARLHGGDAAVLDRDGGGAVVRLRLREVVPEVSADPA